MDDVRTTLRKYSRYVLIIFNFLFVLTGIILISVGVSVKAYYNEYSDILDIKYFYVSDLLIIIGAIIFIIAFFGCCGALKENACMTLTFSSLLIVIFILEAIVGIGGIVLKYKTSTYIEKALNETIVEYGNDKFNETTALFDQIQSKFHCCGVRNYTDWFNTTLNTNGKIPVACCQFPPGATGNVSCSQLSPGLYQIGCSEAFSDYIQEHVTSIESVGITLAVIQLLGIVLSCYLSKQIRSDYETV